MQLRAVKRVGVALSGVKSIEQLLTQAGQLLFDQFNVEAVGLALREGTANVRAMQVLYRGLTDYLISPNRALVEGVHRHLMPRIIGHEDVTFWMELPASLPWSKAFDRAGITCVAAAPLQCSADAQGIIWIGRRGGESLERYHINLLEALAPMIAARIEFACLRQELHTMDQFDPATVLSNEQHFVSEARRLEQRKGHPWSAVCIEFEPRGPDQTVSQQNEIDAVLCDVASTIQRHCPESHLMARLDGSRLGILCPNLRQKAALDVVDQIRKAINQYLAVLADHAVLVAVRLDMASCPEDGHGAVRVLTKASMQVDQDLSREPHLSFPKPIQHDMRAG